MVLFVKRSSFAGQFKILFSGVSQRFPAQLYDYFFTSANFFSLFPFFANSVPATPAPNPDRIMILFPLYKDFTDLFTVFLIAALPFCALHMCVVG